MTTASDFRESHTIFNDPGVADSFVGHYDTLRGRVRSEVTLRHLGEVLRLDTCGPITVLDVGCGDGRDSIRLAELGHHVIGVDPSPEMIKKANENARSAEDKGLKGKINFVEAGLDEVEDKYAPGSFDLLLSHGVLMYQPNASDFIKRHLRLAKTGGFLSILTKNADGLAFRAAQEGHLDEAMRLLDDSQSLGHLGLETQAHTVQEIADIAHAHRSTVRSWAGVRIFTDQPPLADEVIDTGKALELEWRAARRDPVRRVASLIHIILMQGIDLSLLPPLA